MYNNWLITKLFQEQRIYQVVRRLEERSYEIQPAPGQPKDVIGNT